MFEPCSSFNLSSVLQVRLKGSHRSDWQVLDVSVLQCPNFYFTKLQAEHLLLNEPLTQGQRGVGKWVLHRQSGNIN